MAMKRTFGLGALQPQTAKHVQMIAKRILMVAAHHPALAMLMQGKASRLKRRIESSEPFNN
jgi:hypothetical protein